MFILHIFPALFITENFSYKQKGDGCAWTGNMQKGKKVSTTQAEFKVRKSLLEFQEFS